MKNKIIFSLTTALALTLSGGVNAGFMGWGIALVNGEPEIHAACKTGLECPDDVNIPVTVWFDPGLILATGLDLAATKSQNERSIDAKDAIAELEEATSAEGSGSCSSSTDDDKTNLSSEDTVTVVPNDITDILDVQVLEQKDDAFETVRTAVKDYLLYSSNFSADKCGANTKPEDCILERQNTWLLTSVTMASAAGDVVLDATRPEDGKDPLSDEFSDLVTEFNSHGSPAGMWASSSLITLHTHIQQNDINALYARDLEMNALNGVRESDDVRPY